MTIPQSNAEISTKSTQDTKQEARKDALHGSNAVFRFVLFVTFVDIQLFRTRQ